jgi:metal-responsive CopG/Arc/MetJ family transcriptional regulator
MHSQISVRLNEEFHEQLANVAKRLRRKRSDIVRLALEKFISEIDGLNESKPYDQVKSLIGSVSSGIPNLGEAHREYLVKKFKKHD